MSTSAINPTNNTAAPATPLSPAGAALASQNVFLKLLVAQLQYQDPSSPADGTTFVTQLADFTNLSNTTQMASDLDAIKAALTQPVASGSSGTNGSSGGTQTPKS
jgi:flagellar basal-body rod modification protein FlgD